MRPRRRVRRGFDEGWKYAIRAFLPECLQLLFPSLHARIDWTRPVEFLSTELHRLAPAQLRKGVRSVDVDVLVRIYFRDGVPRVVLLHIEIQAQRDPNFPLRLFVYYYRIFDANDYPELISLAILADDDPNWRPSVFERRLEGCNIRFEFPTVKLLDFDEAELEQSENPFALVVLAHLRALKTRGRPNLMFGEKLALIRAMQAKGYTPEQVIELYKVVDYIMALPAELEKRVQEFVRQIEEQSEWPLTSLERLALEEGYADGYSKGLQQGERKGQIRFTMRVLKSRFGDAALPLEEKLVQVPSLETLEELAMTAIEATSLEEFTRALEAALTDAPETAETE
ncbi:MAG: hypothetical protein K6U77_08895 [Armatimonadetes bacterium]|nr:hypothetical protein [Armatimonadota bacterium]